MPNSIAAHHENVPEYVGLVRELFRRPAEISACRRAKSLQTVLTKAALMLHSGLPRSLPMSSPVLPDSCDVVLKDGSTVVFRPSTEADVQPVRAFFESLSIESQYRRFFGLP